jgi:glycerophosphoryl diester phosphodiesterase
MVRVIGHRGASAAHPENTIEAFRGAAEMGAHGVELDVRRTVDDVLVVFHDAHLPTGEAVRSLESAALPPSIPTLAEALDACAELWINIEIKNMPDDPDYDAEHGLSIAVAALVGAYDIADRVVVSSFNIDSVDRIHTLDPTIPTGWLVWGGADPISIIDRAAAHQLSAIHPNDVLVDGRFVERAHAEGLAVYVWTVDDPDRIAQLAALDVDGIITNVPDVALGVLGP